MNFGNTLKYVYREVIYSRFNELLFLKYFLANSTKEGSELLRIRMYGSCERRVQRPKLFFRFHTLLFTTTVAGKRKKPVLNIKTTLGTSLKRKEQKSER